MARNRKKPENPGEDASPSGVARSRKAVEMTASFGLILVVVGLLAPFTDLTDTDYVRFFKWIYAPGALIFTVARIVGSTNPDESMRLRRLRRMEFWAGVAFCMGAFFWFYNERHFAGFAPGTVGTMAFLQDTVYFTLAGAVIQVVSVISVSRRMRKEQNSENRK